MKIFLNFKHAVQKKIYTPGNSMWDSLRPDIDTSRELDVTWDQNSYSLNSGTKELNNATFSFFFATDDKIILKHPS